MHDGCAVMGSGHVVPSTRLFIDTIIQSIQLFPVFQAGKKVTKMPQRTWVSYCFIPCPGIDSCEFYKPGEVNHPLQHEVKKVMSEEDNNLSYKDSEISVSSNDKSNKRLVLSGMFLDNLAPVPFDPKLDPPQITACFNCWHTNHKLKDCYSKKRNKFCSNCGRKYVEVEDCPRCKQAYCDYIEEQEHIQAKIEMYGDVESADYCGRRKEPEKFKPAKKQYPPQSRRTGKKNDFWSGRSYSNDSKTNITTNVCKNVSTTFVKGFTSMNLNTKEQCEPETVSAGHRMMDSSNRDENFEEHTESKKSAYFATNSKFDSNQVNCEGLKKVGDGSDSHNNGSHPSEFEDENEDLKDMIFVDEDDNAVEPNVTEDSNQAYQHLLSVIKNLPEEAQKVAMRCFLNSQKKQSQI